jgi:hypothetical protein
MCHWCHYGHDSLPPELSSMSDIGKLAWWIVGATILEVLIVLVLKIFLK